MRVTLGYPIRANHRDDSNPGAMRDDSRDTSAASSAADDETRGGGRCSDAENTVHTGESNVSPQGSTSASPVAAAADAGESSTSSHNRQQEAELEALRARLGEVCAMPLSLLPHKGAVHRP